MAIELFKLVGSIFIDNEQANKSISKTDEKASNIGKTLLNGAKTAGKWSAAIVGGATAAVSAVAAFATSTANTLDDIDKMSQKIGISAEAYQELSYVMSMNGMDVNILQTGMKTLTTQMSSASSGASSAKAIFSQLGVAYADTNGELRNSEEVLFDTIKALQSMENETERNALASKLFGKSATEMLPLLNAGTENMEELIATAHDLGMVVSDELVADGATLNDTIDTLTRGISAIVIKLGGTLMPIVNSASQTIIGFLPKVSAMFERLAPTITALMDGLLPPLISLVEQVFPILMNLLDLLLPTVIKIVESVLPVLVELLVPILELLSPILEIVIAILDPLLDLINKALTPLMNIFRDLVDKCLGPFKDYLSGIAKFIKGVFLGDWKTAWEGVKQVFTSIWDGLVGYGKTVLNFFIDGINKLIGGINKIQLPDWVPLIGGQGINIPLIPRLAEGGILEKGQLGFLEGNGAEAVVPLQNNKKWIRSVANDMQDNGIGNTSSIEAVLGDILDSVQQLLNAGIYLDKDRLVGALAGPLDKKLGAIQAQKARTY